MQHFAMRSLVIPSRADDEGISQASGGAATLFGAAEGRLRDPSPRRLGNGIGVLSFNPS